MKTGILQVIALAVGMAASAGHASTLSLGHGTLGTVEVPVVSLKASRYLTTVRQQYDFSCGSAAVSTLLTFHYDHPVTEAQVFEAMYQRGDREKIQREGFSLLDMKRYLEHLGFEANGFDVPLDRLVEAGLPGIALINENGYNHFVVIKGVRHGRVLVGDPAVGTRTMTLERFRTMWTNGIVFVITSHAQRARFNAQAHWAAVPRAPITSGIDRSGLSGIVMPKLGPADF